MLTVKELLDFSLLSQAAYANFLLARQADGSFRLDLARTQLESNDGSFTNIQAGDFFKIRGQSP